MEYDSAVFQLLDGVLSADEFDSCAGALAACYERRQELILILEDGLDESVVCEAVDPREILNDEPVFEPAENAATTDKLITRWPTFAFGHTAIAWGEMMAAESLAALMLAGTAALSAMSMIVSAENVPFTSVVLA